MDRSAAASEPGKAASACVLRPLEGKVARGRVYRIGDQLDIRDCATAAASQPSPTKLDGVDMVPFLRKTRETRTQPCSGARRTDGDSPKGLETGQTDLAPNARFSSIAKQPMLYNLANDIGEKTDLAAEQPGKVKEMWETWQKWNAELAPASWPPQATPPQPKKQ